MKLLSLIPAAILTITCSLGATAYAQNKNMEISNHTSETLFFTVKGQCTNEVIVVPYNKVKLSAFDVRNLCKRDFPCDFQAHEKSCSGALAATLTIADDNTIQAQPGSCYKVNSKLGYRHIKFDIYMAMTPLC